MERLQSLLVALHICPGISKVEDEKRTFIEYSRLMSKTSHLMTAAQREAASCLGDNIACNSFNLASTNWAPTVLFPEQFLGAFVATNLMRDAAVNQTSVLWF